MYNGQLAAKKAWFEFLTVSLLWRKKKVNYFFIYNFRLINIDQVFGIWNHESDNIWHKLFCSV
jgi:hypothetical protein